MRGCVFGVCKGRKQWKDEFVLSDNIVWLLYFQAIMWITLIMFPFIAVAAPIVLYLMFRYQYLVLEKLKAKPKKTSNANVRYYLCKMGLGYRIFHYDFHESDNSSCLLCGYCFPLNPNVPFHIRQCNLLFAPHLRTPQDSAARLRATHMLRLWLKSRWLGRQWSHSYTI